MLSRLIVLLSLFVPLSLQALPLPEKVMGTEECAECHEDEVFIWKKTRHFKTFHETARRSKGREIAKDMKVRNPTTSKLCGKCHFTQQLVNGKIKAISGVSCESCHGAAKDWMDIHSDYGGKDVKRDAETAEHKIERTKQSLAAGMIKPENIYALAKNCLQCHLVPHETLVNNSKHKAGSEFELVTWSQGRNRHNFHRSDSGKENIESDQNRKRILYITGQLVEMELVLHALSKATKEDKYSKAIIERAYEIKQRVTTIAKQLQSKEIFKLIDIFNTAELTINQGEALIQIATKISPLIEQFTSNHDGKDWEILDSLIPSENKGFPAR